MEKIVGVITVSDSRCEDHAEDFSGPAVVDAMKHLGYSQFETRIVPDEMDQIQAAIVELCEKCVIVLTTGGTGFSERDITPEATAPLLEKQAISLVELMRMRTYSSSPYAHLSRSVAGVRGRTLILNLPGSPKAVVECVAAVGPLFEPVSDALFGERCGAPTHES